MSKFACFMANVLSSPGNLFPRFFMTWIRHLIPGSITFASITYFVSAYPNTSVFWDCAITCILCNCRGVWKSLEQLHSKFRISIFLMLKGLLKLYPLFYIQLIPRIKISEWRFGIPCCISLYNCHFTILQCVLQTEHILLHRAKVLSLCQVEAFLM